MTIATPPIHTIDNYVFRVYKRSKDFSIKEVINSYGLLMYFTFKPYEPDIVGLLSSGLARLFSNINAEHFTREGFLITFPEQRHFGYCLINLTAGMITDPKTDEKASAIADVIFNIFRCVGLEQYLAKLFSKKFRSEQEFETATKKLFNNNQEKGKWTETKMLKCIWLQTVATHEQSLTFIRDDLYNATKTFYDGLDLPFPERPGSNYEVTCILPDYTFHIRSENITLTMKDIINFFGVVGLMCYEKVFRSPLGRLTNAFIHFAIDATGENRTWSQYKCITTYSDRAALATEFLKSLFCQSFYYHTIESYKTPAHLKAFIDSFHWMMIKPEIFVQLCKKQQDGKTKKLDNSIFAIPGLSKSENNYVTASLKLFYKEVESFTLSERKSTCNTIFKKACITYIELKRRHVETINI